jgi:pyridoxamine 5'-phosphate oxidase
MTRKLADLRKDYMKSSLDEGNVCGNPLDQFARWFEDAEREEVEEPNAMVLSTSDLSGNVSARVVLLKGIGGGGFLFFTNYLSRKGLQLAINPKAALTFHWHPLERQVRVEGRVRKVTRAESMAYFDSRPMESRVSACISPQSVVIPDRPFLEAMRDGFIFDLAGTSPQCPENWGGYRLRPDAVEFWQGREGRLHDRLRYSRVKQGWKVERLAP